MRKLFISLLVLFLTVEINAQSGVEGHGDAHAYEKAVGLRGGFGSGVSYKQQWNNESNYFEGIASYQRKIASLKALYQRIQTTNVDGLRWYYGGGPAIGVGSEFNIGVSLIAGLEFSFFDIPINASLDILPTLLLYRSEGENIILSRDIGAFSLRYILR